MSDWPALRRFTQARIGLGRAGAALATRDLLALQLAHARARDAVWRTWDADGFAAALQQRGIEPLRAASAASDRDTYLKRPDLGRRLAAASAVQLSAARSDPPAEVALVASDGLSAAAIDAHGLSLVTALWTTLRGAGLRCSPVVLLPYGRVAVCDEVGTALGARAAVIVLGERPGLSAADSLGIYLTYDPKPGNTDAQRNCISNVREPDGLAPGLAAERLRSLLGRALCAGLSGVALKAEEPKLP